MKENLVAVVSASDCILVMNVPELNLARTWTKRGMKFLIDRDLLEQAFYKLSVETMFRTGELVTDDKQFLMDVGLLDENEQPLVDPLTEQKMLRLIKNMPLFEFKAELEKLTRYQIQDLADFAIIHYNDLALDRIDVLSKASGKDMLRAITNYKAAEEA